jgi:hypothetical protein
MLIGRTPPRPAVQPPKMQPPKARVVASCALLLSLCYALCPLRNSHAQADGVATLLTRLAQLPGLSARFREEKRIQLLSMPLVSEGNIYFTKPAALLRRVETPEPSSMLLAQGRLSLWDASGQRSFELAAHPALRSLAESFLYVLSGDRKALDALYSMHFSGSAQSAWKLQLVPKPKALAQLIREIKLEGNGLQVQSLQLTEASGDVGTTTFSAVRTDRKFTPEEKRQLFATPASAP